MISAARASSPERAGGGGVAAAPLSAARASSPERAGGGGVAAAPLSAARASSPERAGGGGVAAAPLSAARASSPERAGGGGVAAAPLSAAARARAERQRERARALRAARVAPSDAARAASGAGGGGKRPIDTGGGFLLDEEPAAPRLAAPPPAPRAAPEPCLECGRPVAASFLLDRFDYAVCDTCRDDEGEHALMARTQAKAEFLLKDCDLDARGGGPLPCVQRANPHRAHGAPMRLYLRAQVRERALAVWGGAARLDAERERRAERGERARAARYSRELRALRLAVRGSTLAGGGAPAHAHDWGPETHDARADTYSRACASCGHTQTYEKM